MGVLVVQWVGPYFVLDQNSSSNKTEWIIVSVGTDNTASGAQMMNPHEFGNLVTPYLLAA